MKKLFTLGLLLFLFSTKSICQQIIWQKTIGGSGNDFLECIIPSKDGGFVISGSSNSNISGDKTENSIVYSDYWVVKLDNTGNIVWQNTIGGIDDEYLSSVIQVTDGGYVLGGNSYSNISGDKLENSNGDSDYWLIKLDSIGNIFWQKNIGGADRDVSSSLIQTNEGGYLF